jgi:membrane protein
LLAYLYLLAIIVVLCAEINVVRARRLWPRNLLSPFINDVALTAADKASYRSYVDAERFKPFEQVHTTFDYHSGPDGKAGDKIPEKAPGKAHDK